MQDKKYWVIVPAAGVGRRFGGQIPKQYHALMGKSIIEHTLAKFWYHPRIEKMVVVIDEQDYFWQQLRLDAYSNKILTVTGGLERSHSVFAGLQALANHAHAQDFILVHDSVRPCIQAVDIDKLINTVANHPVGGILGTKVRDTLKYTNGENQILETMPRENIWQALTPQMFRYKLLYQALQNAISLNKAVTDEAAAIELLGFVPMIVEGRRDNIKITYSEDLAVAEKYLNNVCV
jgi:2-C-methyl-D-erythritol 4-phosphate cytidylyltransferase